MEIFHMITAIHLAHFRTQITTADILIYFTRLQNGLYSNYTLSFHFAVAAIAIENMPLTAVQLYRKIIVIPYCYPVSEHVFTGHRITVVRLIKSFHIDLNPFRNFIRHGVCLHKNTEKAQSLKPKAQNSSFKWFVNVRLVLNQRFNRFLEPIVTLFPSKF